MKFPTYEEMGQKVAEQALDEVLINGKTLREWLHILSDELSILEKIRAEIIEKYWDCDICKWKINYKPHYNIRGDINDILQIIDKYKGEGSDKE